MHHGQINCEVTILGEPHRLLRNWRATLGSFWPEKCSVSLVLLNQSRFGQTPHLKLFSITRGEKTLAEQTLSAVSMRLNGDEIREAQILLATMYNWLDRRGYAPIIEREMKNLRLTVVFEGAAESVIAALERLHDSTLVSSAQFKLGVLDGRPRTVHTRHPNPIRCIDDADAAIRTVDPYRNLLALGQEKHFLELVNRLRCVLRKRGTEFVRLQRELAIEFLGPIDGREWVAEWSRRNGYNAYPSQFDLDDLSATFALPRKPSVRERRIRSWRS